MHRLLHLKKYKSFTLVSLILTNYNIRKLIIIHWISIPRLNYVVWKP